MASEHPGSYRHRLGRPPIRPGRRSPTTALLLTDDGHGHELTSGTGDEYYALAAQLLRGAGLVAPRHVPEIAAHVEIKAAIWMQTHQHQNVQLVTNGIACAGPHGCASELSSTPTAWTCTPPGPVSPPVGWAYYRENHDQTPVPVRDRSGILSLPDDLAAQPFDHSLAALYLPGRPRNHAGLPDHELRIGVDAETRRAALRYMGGPGTWHSVGWRSQRDDVCFYYMRNDAPFPIDAEISLDEAADSIEAFLGSDGRRPENIAWKPVAPSPVITGHPTTR